MAAALGLAAAHPSLAGAQGGLTTAVGRRVESVELDNRSRVPDAEIRDLFLLRPGDVYDPRAVQRSLSLLSQKEAIRNVSVDGRESGIGLALHLEVTAEPLARVVRFRGNDVLPDRELRGRLRTRPDRPVQPVLLEGDVRAIRELYAEVGYPAVAVSPLVEASADGYWLKVTFEIQEGNPERIADLQLGDVPPDDRQRALALLGLHEGSVASERALREGVRKLLGVYHREGYREARAPKARFERGPEGVTLVLPLVLGQAVDLRFEGIDEWAARPLLEVAESRSGERVDSDWADDVAAAMVADLQSKGYTKALIAPELEEREGRRRITFRVEPGVQVRVEQVRFEGNDTQSSRRLRSYLSVVQGGIFRPPPFTQDALDRDLRVLRDYYASRGFWDARVDVEPLDVADDGAATLHVRIAEGTRYRLGRVSFECDCDMSADEARGVAQIDPGEWADPGALEAARVRLLAEFHRRGHADAQVTYRAERRPGASEVDVTYTVGAGPLVRFGKVVVAGNARTHTKVLLRELTFREGGPWDAEQVLLSRQKLARLGYFQKIRIEPLGEGAVPGTRDVRVAVEEQDAGSVTFGLGYGTEEGVKGFAEVAHANLLGSGREVRLRGDAEGRDWSYALSFREPWLFGYPNDLTLSLIKQYQDREAYELDLTAFRASLDRRITGRIRVSLLYVLSYNELSDVAESADVSDIDQYLLSAFGPVLAWDSRDDPFNPRKGHQHTIQAEWALEAIGSEVQYGRYVASTAGYYSYGRFTLALQGRGGLAMNFLKGIDLPVNRRFFLGGRASVRGFERDEIGPKAADGTPLGGDTMLNFRAELRFPLWKQLGGDLFWDAGNVWDRENESPDYLTLRQGAGGGLRYNTPVGPIALDIGYKLDRKEGESASEWNFTIGNVF